MNLRDTVKDPEVTRKCPRCEALIPRGAEECPRCLLEAVVSPPADEAISSGVDMELLRKDLPQLEILEEIGRGGMGVVFRARQRGLDREVALKVLLTHLAADPSFPERFSRESRALAGLSHPNIVAVHDAGEAGGHHYILMEYVEGTDLRRLAKERRLEPEQVFEITSSLCEALQYAHDNGVIHRDIKPENVLIDRSGSVKIGDFGLAKLMGEDGALRLTGTMQVMGTFHYLAPEQIERPKEVDHRVDIFSLGVVFYELLTGELPIGHFDAPSKKVKIDVKLDEAVLKALQKEPARRYQSVCDLHEDIRRASSGRALLGTRSNGKLFSGGWLQLAGGALALTIVGLLCFYLVNLERSADSLLEEVMQENSTEGEAIPAGLVELDTVELGTVEPGTVEPDAVEPGTVEPGTVEPGTAEPDAAELGTVEAGAGQVVGVEEEAVVGVDEGAGADLEILPGGEQEGPEVSVPPAVQASDVEGGVAELNPESVLTGEVKEASESKESGVGISVPDDEIDD